jgi:hypothetical protein
MRRWLPVVLAALALVGCTGGDDGSADRATPKAEPHRPTLSLVAADLVSPAQAQGPLDQAIVDLAMGTVESFYRATVEGPAVNGKAGEIRPLMTPEALADAVGRDRTTVFDEGLTSKHGFDGTLAIRLRGFADDDGVPMLVVAAIDWTLQSPDGSVRIHRTGELTLQLYLGTAPVSAYELTVDRSAA